MRTITAMFDSRAEAENARSRLAGVGVSNDNVTIHDKTSLGDHDAGNRSNDRDTSRDTGTRSGVGYGSGVTAGHADVNQGHAQASNDGGADGREGIHRNVIGDFIDNRTGEKMTGEPGGERTMLGDFVEDGDPRREDSSDRAGGHDDNGSVWDRIKAFFTGDDHIYEEGLRRGGYLLTARVEDSAAEHAIAILDDEGTVNLDERQASWRSDGWSSGSATPRDGDSGSRVRSYSAFDQGL